MTKPIVVNTHRIDPYKGFRFRVIFGGKIVAAANNVTGLGSKIAPSLNKGSIVTMTHGITSDSGFTKWASGFTSTASAPATRRPLPRSLVLRMHDETGRIAASWKLGRCAVASFQQARNKKHVAIESLQLKASALECC